MSKPQAWAAGSVEPPAKERPIFKAERRLPAVGMYKLRGVGKGDVAFLALIAVLTAIYFYYVFTHCECKPPVVNFHTAGSADDTQLVDKLMKKLEAVKYLNEKRAEANAPPLQLIELNVAKWRAEYIARTGHYSSFDLEGRNPNYWYTRLDGGMYGAKEVLAWIKHLNSTSRKYGFRDGIAMALRGYWGHMLNPCYNYIAMETTYAYESGGIVLYRIEYYVFWLIAKWIDWTSPPLYDDGRFTAEGYAAPEMKPIALVIRHAPHRGSPFVKNTYEITAYNLGDVISCMYLDPPSSCNNAPKPNGTVVVSKMLNSDNWYIKIDVSIQFDKPGLYTFELLAEDLRAKGRKCPIMQYTVEVAEKT